MPSILEVNNKICRIFAHVAEVQHHKNIIHHRIYDILPREFTQQSKFGRKSAQSTHLNKEWHKQPSPTINLTNHHKHIDWGSISNLVDRKHD